MELLILINFIWLSALIDMEHLIDDDYIEDHTSRFILRTLFIYVIFREINWQFVGAVMVFMASFDSTLNLMRGLPINYLGSTAKWDIFWKKYPVGYILMKVICLLIGIGLILEL
jgi:hypothetical protein